MLSIYTVWWTMDMCNVLVRGWRVMLEELLTWLYCKVLNRVVS